MLNRRSEGLVVNVAQSVRCLRAGSIGCGALPLPITCLAPMQVLGGCATMQAVACALARHVVTRTLLDHTTADSVAP